MPLFKNKDHSNKQATTAAAFSSIIVIDGYTLRPVKRASTAFRNSTIFVSLFTNRNCSFSELFEYASALSKIWRSIINKDVKYQQQLDNLPSFVGVRHICFRPLCNETFEPYIVVELDNLQAAAFVARSWCKRTGQMPREFSIACRSANNKPYVIVEEFHKSQPLYIELMWERYKCKLEKLTFGAAVSIEKQNKTFEAHVIPVQGVRCSQSFGKEKNIYTRRKIQKLYESKAEGTLEALRRKRNKCEAKLEYERAKKALIYSHVHRSEYGAKEIFGVGSRYTRARDKYIRVDAKAAAAIADGLRLGDIKHDHILTDEDVRTAQRLGATLPANYVTIEQLEQQEAEAKVKVEVVEAEEVVEAKPLTHQRKRRLKEAFARSFNEESTQTWDNVNAVDVEAVITKLKEVAKVKVEANGQITIDF